jgi:hypothetical protein
MNFLQIILIILILAVVVFAEYHILVDPCNKMNQILEALNLKFFVESDSTD